jgi:hypothetical protein
MVALVVVFVVKRGCRETFHFSVPQLPIMAVATAVHHAFVGNR